MANLRPGKHHEEMKARILNVAAKNFLKQGYTNTTIKQIASEAGMSVGSLTNIFQTKDDLLCELVSFVLSGQFSTARRLLEGRSDDKLLFYAVETALQLHIVEMNENLRDVYSAAYSLPKPSAMIQQTITGKWENIFKEHLPELETKDFYKLEIATGGIMRGFMTIPCNMWFTIDQKVESFLECSFKMYDVPKPKIREAVEFVKSLELDAIAKETINGLISSLEA